MFSRQHTILAQDFQIVSCTGFNPFAPHDALKCVYCFAATFGMCLAVSMQRCKRIFCRNDLWIEG